MKIGRLEGSLPERFFLQPYLQDTLEFLWSPLFKDKSFLHTHYVENGQSAEEVAALSFSSKATVLKHLKLFNIPVREINPGVRRRRCVAYGQRMAGRQLVANQRELAAFNRMKDLRSKGFTYEAIAEVMNSMRVRTKTGHGRWHRKTVQAILTRVAEPTNQVTVSKPPATFLDAKE